MADSLFAIKSGAKSQDGDWARGLFDALTRPEPCCRLLGQPECKANLTARKEQSGGRRCPRRRFMDPALPSLWPRADQHPLNIRSTPAQPSPNPRSVPDPQSLHTPSLVPPLALELALRVRASGAKNENCFVLRHVCFLWIEWKKDSLRQRHDRSARLASRPLFTEKSCISKRGYWASRRITKGLLSWKSFRKFILFNYFLLHSCGDAKACGFDLQDGYGLAPQGLRRAWDLGLDDAR
jgi:hypothetical protein